MGTATASPILKILLVEDSLADVLLTREALELNQAPVNLHVVEDGENALAFLRQQREYGSAPRPDLILLDLNLPRLDGREVLAAIKSDPALRTIPLVILTTSRAEEDVQRAYDGHANCYITKPLDFVQFTQVIRSIERFWFDVATLPPG
jgi:CheY-like chemotaxis protein